jgi:ParB family chromosome partitioning protein
MDLIRRPEVPDRASISDEEINELAESIRERGLLVPIQVNRRDSGYEIVFGDRRYLACKKLGLKRIRCIVKDYDQKEMIIDRAIENVARRNLSDIEEARAFIRLHDVGGLSWEEIGRRVGYTGGSVKRKTALLTMDMSIQESIHEKKISVGVAEAIMRCPDVAHREYLLSLAIEHGVTVTVMRMWVDDFLSSLRKSEGDVSEGGGPRFPGVAEPVFRACQLCRGPVEIGKMMRIECCEECGRAIIDVIKSGGR